MEPFRQNWVVRYYPMGKPLQVHTFAGFKKSGKPSYSENAEKIRLFRLYKEAFEVARELLDTGEYMAEVCKISAGKEEHFYFN